MASPFRAFATGRLNGAALIRHTSGDVAQDIAKAFWGVVSVQHRALVLQNGEIAQIPDLQIGTGKRPLVLVSSEIRERVSSEGTPLVVTDGAIRTIDPTFESIMI